MNRPEFAATIREKYMLNESLDTGQRFEVYDALFHTGSKLLEYFGSHEHISISVSGGSDSDCIVHLVCTYFPEFLDKCKFVFVNTGLEYDATKRHLCDLEKRYGIEIDKIRGRSVVTVVRKYGIPILSKIKSTFISDYVRGLPYAERVVFYDGVKSYNAMKFTENQRILARHIKENGIKVSSKCCTLSKKEPLHNYNIEHEIDLSVTGERQIEGGQRALIHKSCFEEHKNGEHTYMPLWWWSNETKQIFKETEGIRYSDCYEVYGMKRTGCCGCPFNLNIADDLQAMYEYEPRLFKACMNVFGRAYELTDRFNCRRKKCLPDSFQMTLTGEIERNEP